MFNLFWNHGNQSLPNGSARPHEYSSSTGIFFTEHTCTWYPDIGCFHMEWPNNNAYFKHEVFMNYSYEQIPTHCRAGRLVSHGYLLLLRLLIVAGGHGFLLDLLGLQVDENIIRGETSSAQEQNNIHHHLHASYSLNHVIDFGVFLFSSHYIVSVLLAAALWNKHAQKQLNA